MSHNPLAIPEYTSEDFTLLKSAFRRRWPITDEARQRILENVIRIGTDQATHPRDVVGAMRVLVEVDRLEVEAIKTLVAVKEAQLLEERVNGTPNRVATDDEIGAGLASLVDAARSIGREAVEARPTEVGATRSALGLSVESDADAGPLAAGGAL